MQALVTFYKTSYLNEEGNYTYPSPSVGVPFPVVTILNIVVDIESTFTVTFKN